MACMAFATSAHAQQSAVETSRTQDSAQPGYVIRARVPITIVDVVVTDAKGNPVHGLTQSDFTVLEDGKEMKPGSFEEHRTDEATPAAPMLVKQNLPPNTFTNATPTPPKTGPINILLLDNLNTPSQAQQQVTQRMLDFVNKMPPETQMAIFGLSTHLYILQGFTSDRELLKAALTSKKNFAQLSPIEDLGQEGLEPPAPEPPDAVTEKEGNHSALQGQYTISAMRQIARYVSGMPGRKNLIWFSGSFPLQFPPVTDPIAFPGTTSQGSVYDLTDEMKSATDLMARAHVVLYPIDWRGPKQLATSSKTYSGLTNQGNMLFGERGTMQDIADQTGGKFFYNTNDFAGAVEQAIDTGSNFYTITYAPTNQALDTRFRSITVKVDRPGLNLVYRNGYYAVEPDTDSRGKKIEKVSTMQAPLMRGALDATQVLFKITVAQAPGTEAKLPADNQPDVKQMKPPYRHYTISYSIDVHGIDFNTSPDGNYRGNFEYGVRVYNADGDEIVNSVSTTISPILPPVVYRSMLRTGANASQQIDVPATGDFFLRIAVHDLASDRVGAIEVPTASIAPESAPAIVVGR
jgi:VWFA-related protein